MDRLTESVVTIMVAIIGLATLATLVSKQANTTAVIGAGSGAFNSALSTALSPVTGGSGLSGGGFNGAGLTGNFANFLGG